MRYSIVIVVAMLTFTLAATLASPVSSTLSPTGGGENSDLTSNLLNSTIEGDDPDEEVEDTIENEYDDPEETSATNQDKQSAGDNVTVIEDYFGNIVKIGRNRTTLKSKARDLGIKALLLGPFVGVTIKAALIRGLLWALLAYGLHLLFPALLSTLGLGTGLVGFARQFNPGYMQILMPQLANLPAVLINAVPQSTRQQLAQYSTTYSPYLNPIVQTISSIPEEVCRYRAVCEAASYVVSSSPFMSNSLQRLSATAYVNIGTDYSKAWLDGVVQSDCAAKYSSCATSPFKTLAGRLAESIRAHQMAHPSGSASKAAVEIANNVPLKRS